MSAPLVLIGSYTRAESDEGIVVCRQDPDTGALTRISSVTGVLSPSFLTLSPDRKRLFTVNESAPTGHVSSFVFDPATGNVEFCSKQPSLGGSPCHLCTDPQGRFLFVANHEDGSVTCLPIRPDGALEPACDRKLHEGKGPGKTQQGPHAHFVGFDPTGLYLLAVDKGIDKVMVYRFKEGKMTAHDPPFASLEPGTAPRHLAFHPNGHWCYVNGEADLSVTTFEFDGERGSFKAIERINTLPKEEIKGSFTSAEIAVHPSGRFLYASNRGHNSLTLFEIGSNGLLTFKGVFPTVQNPRHFAIDPARNYMYVGSQDASKIAVYRIDKSGGLESTNQETDAKSPVCILFV